MSDSLSLVLRGKQGLVIGLVLQRIQPDLMRLELSCQRLG
jgi:hypothetical protein